MRPDVAVRSRRILVIDDTPSIHADFRKILQPPSDDEALARARASFFDESPLQAPAEYDLDFALQGREGVELAQAALDAGRPYAVAFVDMRMPPGWDGVETVEALWRADARLQVVVCTAYSDLGFEEIVARLGSGDRLLILKKPFDAIEVRQFAGALTEKWSLAREAALRVADLEDLVGRRTAELSAANAALRARFEALHRAEQESRERSQELERANVELRAANEAARAAARSKSEFLANMSHEIRTPMTAILGFADLLLDAALPAEERAAHLDTIRRNGDHLLSILNDILDLSKIEAGRMPILRAHVAPLELAGEVVKAMRGRAREKGLDLTVTPLGAVPAAIESDPTRLRQILFNLIANAIKFTPSGGIEIQVGLEPFAPDAPRRIAFAVIDTGIGIAAEKLAQLFQPFSQVDNSTTRPFGGTGLGLLISQRLARLLGGDIRVESRPGAGSTFTATVAVGAAVAAPPPAQRPAAGARAESEAPAVALEGRILLAEDGRDNQRLLCSILRRAGALVTLADNGRIACELALAALAAGRPFDVVLMDMQMPELDGYDAARHLRTHGYRGAIVALTAHAMAGDRETCLAAGCDDYATKPIERDTLLALCARHLARAHPPSALPRTRVVRLGDGSPILRRPDEPFRKPDDESPQD